MTPFVLLDELKKFVEAQTKDLLLPVRLERNSQGPKERAPEVFTMRLKKSADKTNKVPYVLLQFIKSEDRQEPGQRVECVSWVRIIAATYAVRAECFNADSACFVAGRYCGKAVCPLPAP